MKTFKDFNLKPKILQVLEELKFIQPSPIQEEAVPFILESKQDLIALAQTGTGKTAAYSLPILNQIEKDTKSLQAIILCPTRELCLQISQDVKSFAKHSPEVAVTAVYGGARIDLQIKSLKQNSNIIVGTPGRVHDLIRRKILKLQDIKWVVLDEADEMLDMGFKEDLDAILAQTPENRQTLLFSATMSKSVNAIAKKYMKKAHEISIGEKNIGADKVEHEYYVVSSRDKFEALKRILDHRPGVYGIIFCRTKIETQFLADKLSQGGYNTEALHGDVSQNMRTKIMEKFKQKKINLLVATDVAARGIDVNNLSHIINYSLPEQSKSYTHRSGRTGRAQNTGIAISLITPREVGTIKRWVKVIGKNIEQKKIPTQGEVANKQIDNFGQELEDTQVSEKDVSYFAPVVEKLKKLTKEEIINKFLANKFNNLSITPSNNSDLNANAANYKDSKKGGESVNVKINIGKNQGFEVKDLFSLINKQKKLKGIEIGKINLKDNESIFAVEARRAEELIKVLSKETFKKTKLSLSKTSGSPEINKRKRRGGERGKKFRGRRR